MVQPSLTCLLPLWVALSQKTPYFNIFLHKSPKDPLFPSLPPPTLIFANFYCCFVTKRSRCFGLCHHMILHSLFEMHRKTRVWRYQRRIVQMSFSNMSATITLTTDRVAQCMLPSPEFIHLCITWGYRLYEFSRLVENGKQTGWLLKSRLFQLTPHYISGHIRTRQFHTSLT